MNAEELNRKAVSAGIPRAIMEKDYVLSVVLFHISKSALAERMLFKGGTALKKVYFPDARFSEDLDFTARATDERMIMDELKSLFEGKELNGVRFASLEKERSNAGLRAALKFSSILGHVQRIRFDFSFRENTASKPEKRAIVDEYKLGNAELLVIPLEELFAEKINALFGRIAVRDLYDVWFLFKRGIRTDKLMIKKKFAYYNEEYEPSKLKERINSFRKDWKRDLAQFMNSVPDFDGTADETVKFLER